MTRHNITAFGAVRIAPDGESLAWFRPDSDDDGQPWLVITEDPTVLGVEHDWASSTDVATWTELQDPDVTRADDADLAAEAAGVVVAADPLPKGLADRICQDLHGVVGSALLAEVTNVIEAADPVPTGLPERVRRAADTAGGGAS